MSSTLTVFPPDPDAEQRSHNSLSVANSPNNRDPASPNSHHFETPGASSSALSYYSDFEDPDPFFGVAAEGQPSFYDDDPSWQQLSFSSANPPFKTEPLRNALEPSYIPLTPDKTASIHTASPGSEHRKVVTRQNLPPSISPQELQKPTFKPQPIITQPSQLTPSQSSSARSSEDGLAPARISMQAQSPRVTVSVYDHDETAPTHTTERFFDDHHPASRSGIESAGDLISSGEQHPTSAPRDANTSRPRYDTNGRGGIGPNQRTSNEIPSSMNEMANQREKNERNESVDSWISSNLDEVSAPHEQSFEYLQNLEKTPSGSDDNIPLGDNTENRYVPGQTYINPNGGPMNDTDREIIAGDRVWGNVPLVHQILKSEPGRHQPPTAQDAINRFELMCRDNDSILSRQATWGTRRRSIHSTTDVDVEGILSGNLFKKLSINSKSGNKGNKATGLLRELRGRIARSPSISSIRKRRSSNASNASDDGNQDDGPPLEKKDSAGSPHLAPPDRTSSWGKNKTPSINTAFLSMATGAAAVGSTRHARQGSVGASSVKSPRGLMQSLKVENTLTRPASRARSKSEVPKPTASPDSADSHPNLMGMWKASGGPPFAPVGRPSLQVEPEDDDDDDDELQDDSEMRTEANRIDEITANFAGFQSHVLMLNPGMEGSSNYLVDRIAHQQIVRYKTLLGLKVKHLGMGAHCPCGSLCIALGGQANVLDQKGDARGIDPLASHFPDDEDGNTPTDGAINQDSFPVDIPMPPSQSLPAEFECQLCYATKKFTKPSDWTKHVHEDVQPFTCTWDRCRDAKSFKRKADWVRHENEGHRHLEWWTCDVDECRHTCYRRDNFLQHLVREHKFPEPKVKTKAAMKKSGGGDPTWKKVEECHVLTHARPIDEPCRFCGKAFPSWKKLTVHLAKHMEQISLPVLRLVAAKAREISADTIISPVQDPPPRQMFNAPIGANGGFAGSYPGDNILINNPNSGYQDPNNYPNMYSVMPPNQQYGQQPTYYANQYDGMGQPLQPGSLGIDTAMNPGFDHMSDIPATSASYAQNNQYMTVPNNNNLDNGLEPFPQLPDGLGLQNNHGGHMNSHVGYNNMMDPSTASHSPFSGHGSASPYVRSPHQGVDNSWDERHMSGF